jgi:hypothetical protein
VRRRRFSAYITSLCIVGYFSAWYLSNYEFMEVRM